MADDENKAFAAFTQRGSRTRHGLGGTLQPDFILKTKEFEDCNENFVKELALRATVELFTDGDVVLHQGDIADKLYFLKSGDVDIWVNHVKVSSVGSGSVFGLAAMFDTSGGFNKRNATVKSIGFCDCRVVSRAVFLQALKNYPEEKKHFQELAKKQAEVAAANKASVAKIKLQRVRQKMSVMTPASLMARLKDEELGQPVPVVGATAVAEEVEEASPSPPAPLMYKSVVPSDPNAQHRLEMKRRASIQRARVPAASSQSPPTTRRRASAGDAGVLSALASPPPRASLKVSSKRFSADLSALEEVAARAVSEPLPEIKPRAALSGMLSDDEGSEASVDLDGDAFMDAPMAEGVLSEDPRNPSPRRASSEAPGSTHAGTMLPSVHRASSFQPESSSKATLPLTARSRPLHWWELPPADSTGQ